MHITRKKMILLTAEEQLVFGCYLGEVKAARDELQRSHPDSLLLELVDAKIKRLQTIEQAPTSPWAS